MSPVTEREQWQGIGTDFRPTGPEAATTVGEKVEHAAEALGAGIEAVGCAIREHSPQHGILCNAGEAIGEKLEAGGHYLHDHGLTGVATEFTNCIRRNPIPSLLVGLGVGLLLARMVRR